MIPAMMQSGRLKCRISEELKECAGVDDWCRRCVVYDQPEGCAANVTTGRLHEFNLGRC